MKLSGAQILLKELQAEGVDTIFGYPGGAVIGIYDELAKTDIRHILVRHEQAAVHAADGYARASGRVGVCLVTSGPGATNTVTGIANAFMDSIPVVILTGQVPTQLIGNDAFQEVDITGITIPITKHNYLLQEAAEVPHTIQEAFFLASTGRKGPVLLDIPRDVPILRMSMGDQNLIKPGAHIFAGARKGADGNYGAAFLMVGEDGIVPTL